MIDLEELERLEREATPGPWRRDADYPQLVAGMASVPGGVPYFAPADAALIVAARNALPALLARVRELEATNREQAAIIDAGRAAHLVERRTMTSHARTGFDSRVGTGG